MGHPVTCLATIAYVYAACTVCVTILVLVVNSHRFQILRSYTLLFKPPVLMGSWLKTYDFNAQMLQVSLSKNHLFPGLLVKVTYMYLFYSLAQLFHSSLVTCVSCLCWSRCGLHKGLPPLAEGKAETFSASVHANYTVHAVVEIKRTPLWRHFASFNWTPKILTDPRV